MNNETKPVTAKEFNSWTLGEMEDYLTKTAGRKLDRSGIMIFSLMAVYYSHSPSGIFDHAEAVTWEAMIGWIMRKGFTGLTPIHNN